MMKEIHIDEKYIYPDVAAKLRANQEKAAFIKKLTASQQNHRLALDIQEKRRRHETQGNL